MSGAALDEPWRLSARGRSLADSAIRAVGKRIAQSTGLISFAGGMPSPDTFAPEVFAQAFDAVLRADGRAALQYGPTDGYAPLREWIAQAQSSAGCTIGADQVVVTSGSQQGLDLLGKVLLDAGDGMAVETPTYVGALQALGQYFPHFVPLESDDDGLVPQALPQALHRAARDGVPCRLLYTIPTFQNPTGRTLPQARREALMSACASAGVAVVEDDPYGALDFEGERHTTLLSLDPPRVLHLGSFSKVLSPGIRLGYLVAPRPLARRFELAKQASDLHSSSLLQRVVFEIVKDGFLERHLARCRDLYRQRAQAMVGALEQHLRGAAQWRAPGGGMFMWLTLPPGSDAAELLEPALAAGVAFVPGAPFFAHRPQRNTLRLCFSTGSPEQIARGIGALAQVVLHDVSRRRT